MPVTKGVDHNAASLKVQKNESGKVWCVTVPSGVIVVRRNGFSMVCGNCAEAQALRKAWPEVGQDATAEEMEGKHSEIDITPAQQPRQIAPASSVDKLKPATKPAAPVSFDEAPSRVEQLIINLAECQTADDVNAWGNAAAAEFAEGTPEYVQLLEAYNNKLAQIA